MFGAVYFEIILWGFLIHKGKQHYLLPFLLSLLHFIVFHFYFYKMFIFILCIIMCFYYCLLKQFRGQAIFIQWYLAIHFTHHYVWV